MPELPEVETIRSGIMPYVMDQSIDSVIIRQPKLRWDIPSHLAKKMVGYKVTSLLRRGKYLIFDVGHGAMIVHLGMSGSLRIMSPTTLPKKHDHVDIVFTNQSLLRFNDPRRFGAMLWAEKPILAHPLLVKLGVEPLADEFSGKYLFNATRNRTIPIKSFIMNSHIVTGIGNIYATEALFAANIHPLQSANDLSLTSCQRLTDKIKFILASAIKQGGTTLKDFTQSDGKPGYFKVNLKVYGRDGEPCIVCGTPLGRLKIAQRSTVYCEHCQVSIGVGNVGVVK